MDTVIFLGKAVLAGLGLLLVVAATVVVSLWLKAPSQPDGYYGFDPDDHQ